MMWFQCIQVINMKKIIALLFVATFATSASAAMTQTCQDYYKEIDNFMDKMKEMGTPDAQINVIKQQYEQSKQQISALPESSQDMACKQGLEALKQSMSAVGIK